MRLCDRILVGALAFVLAAGCEDGPSGQSGASFDPSLDTRQQAITDPTLSSYRDYLLGTLGQTTGGQFSGDKCSVWRQMDQSQKWEFLVFTDSIAQRTPLDYESGTALAHVTRVDWIWGTCPPGTHWVKGPGTDGYCYWNGSNQFQGTHECGTTNRNRVFAEIDDTLLWYFRNHNIVLPTWHGAFDSAHGCFSNVTEQSAGPYGVNGGDSLNHNLDAGGQLQFFQNDGDASSDWLCLCFTRGLNSACSNFAAGVPASPKVVEFDVDYGILHSSSMTCSYNDAIGWRYGITQYQAAWSNQPGVGGINLVTNNDPDLDYDPCASSPPAQSGATYCTDTPENATATLSCPGGSTINAITFGAWGTPDTFTCGSYWYGWNTSDVSGTLRSMCLGRQSCSIAASTGTFGDPNLGVLKKLGVQYTCAGSTPQITSIVNNVNGASNSGFVNNYIQIGGNNFCSSGLQVYLSGYGYTYAYPVGTNQVNAYIYSGTALGGQYASVMCNGSASNAWYFVVSNQQTSVCGNGSCEAGENGASCGADCCDYYTSCNQSYLNQGQSYCRSFNGGGYGWYSPQTCGSNWGYGTRASCGTGTTYYCCSSINNWTTNYCSY